MKIKKLAAVFVCAALTVTTAVSMTACKNDKNKSKGFGTATLDIDDYAEEASAAEGYKVKSYDELKGMGSVALYENAIVDRVDDYFILKSTRNNYNYALYNLPHGHTVLRTVNRPTFTYRYVSGYRLDMVSHRVESAGENYLVYNSFSGAKLAECDYYSYYDSPSFDLSYYYVTWADEKMPVLTVRYSKPENYTTVSCTKYFRVKIDESVSKITTDVEIDVKHLKEYGGEFNVGTNPFYGEKIYEQNYEKPVAGDMANYSVKEEGNTYTFYNGEMQTGSVQIKNGTELGYIDNYFYYCTLTPVSPDAEDGYNFISAMYNANALAKFSYSLFRYDILTSTTEELDVNAVVTNISTFYNYNEKTYNAAVVSGYEMIDGIAYVYNTVDSFSYVVDKNFGKAYDVSNLFVNTPVYNEHSLELYKLGEDKYYAAGKIVDKDFNVLSEADSVNCIYEKEELVRFGGSGGYGFKDMNGKVIVEPKYSSEKNYTKGDLVFYGGCALAYEIMVDGTYEQVIIYIDGRVFKLSDIAKSYRPEVEKSIKAFGGVYELTVKTYTDFSWNSLESWVVEYYSLSGKLIKTIEMNALSNGNPELAFEELGDYCYLLETVETESGRLNRYYEVGKK